VEARSLAPLEAIANSQGADNAAARGLVELFNEHTRKTDAATTGAPPEEQQTAPPQTGLSIPQ
jgi:hypothetical protein